MNLCFKDTKQRDNIGKEKGQFKKKKEEKNRKEKKRKAIFCHHVHTFGFILSLNTQTSQETKKAKSKKRIDVFSGEEKNGTTDV